MTICALLLGAAVLRPASPRAAEVRDARPAVRQRVDRRHADPLRGAAGADGGAAVGLGHAVHARAFRMAGGRGHRRVHGVYVLIFRRELAELARRPVPDIDVPEEHDARGEGRQTLLPVPAWVTIAHAVFMAWTVFNVALPGAVPRRVPVLPRLRPRHGAVSEPGRPQGAAAGRLLPRGPGHPRRPAGLVDRAGARQPERDSRCSPPRRS